MRKLPQRSLEIADREPFILRRAAADLPLPDIGDDGAYVPGSGGRDIRVYTELDVRLMFADFFAKLRAHHAGARGDETLLSPTFSAAGLDDGHYAVYLRVTDNLGATTTTPATVEVANVAPTLTLGGSPNVNEGSAYALTLGTASDPGPDSVTQYVVDWGDGSELQTLSGPSETAVEHTFTAPGTYTAFFGATDKDGGTQEPNGVEIEVTGSATTTTTTAHCFSIRFHS